MFEQRPLPDSGTLVDHEQAVRFLRDMYSGLLAHAAAEIGELFRGMAADDGLPALFHCTAGKDRTGVVAALLLTWLGVDRELVLDDFELTEQYAGHQMHEQMFQRMLERGMGPEAAAGMLHATRASMQAAARRARFARYGGIERYLRDDAGVDADTLRTLRQRLLALTPSEPLRGACKRVARVRQPWSCTVVT